MATEDLTTYTEVDPNSKITVTVPKSSFVNLSLGETAYVYKDKTADHFDGDFEHLIDTKMISAVGENAGCVHWMLANDILNRKGFWDQNKSNLNLNFFKPATGECYLALEECYLGSGYLDSYVGVLNTPYYLKFKRDENIGAFGRLYCYIYSDAARTNLLDTLQLDLHAKLDFRYIYVTNTTNYGLGARVATGYSENLDLQEVVPVGRSHGYIF